MEKGPRLIKTIDGKSYLQLIKLGTVEIDGLREWSLCISTEALKGEKLQRGKSHEFPIIALVEVIE